MPHDEAQRWAAREEYAPLMRICVFGLALHQTATAAKDIHDFYNPNAPSQYVMITVMSLLLALSFFRNAISGESSLPVTAAVLALLMWLERVVWWTSLHLPETMIDTGILLLHIVMLIPLFLVLTGPEDILYTEQEWQERDVWLRQFMTNQPVTSKTQSDDGFEIVDPDFHSALQSTSGDKKSN